MPRNDNWDADDKRIYKGVEYLSTNDWYLTLFGKNLLFKQKSSFPKVTDDGNIDLLRKRISHLADRKTESVANERYGGDKIDRHCGRIVTAFF